ncbi:MAG: endonuclease III [Prolixibacteraceae bacterium]|jgi:endonuclease III|nr:endonuclease III [Prolixibacteraceae bacterium]MBT6007122.1 endonuclease III [Prolixibacteraceae bacterium]MBT6765876.1 endonuclease III [Prolixibacteraceae bacterium]MBT6998343.1 endonuclease III [Prolixibacteraceae bacterium]MBT7396813.1 endonuclease III [Prolixibacteraceae bacterium]
MRKRELFEYTIQYFETTMPIAETELEYKNAFELIVAVILSAQCTDKRVNLITPDLLKRFPTPYIMAEVEPAEVFDYIKSCSYPNNKAKHLVGMAKKLIELFNGVVPSDVDDLQKLPGVGRKTANVIASVVYNKPTLAVDTHVFRVAARIGLSTNAKTPLATELQLMKYIPEMLVAKAHHWLILHGRYTCVARKPKCEKCGLTEVCKFYNKQNNN